MNIKKTAFGAFAALALLAGGAAILAPTGLNTASAQQQSAKAIVDASIAQGVIGEQIDGYLGVVSGQSPSADQRRAMDEINIARKSHYTRRARFNGVSVEEYAAATGEKLLQRAASGTMIRGNNGIWTRR